MISRTRVVAVVAFLAAGLLGVAVAVAAKPPHPQPPNSSATTGTTDTSTTVTSTTTSEPTGPGVNSVATLYAATGGGCTGSTLYTLDPSTAAATPVGDITVSGNQVLNVSGLAIDPTNEQMYGWMNPQDCSRNGGTLLQINKADGTATIVGSEGDGGIQASDLTFDKYGQLYAWSGGCGDISCNSNGSDLYTINKATGTSAKVSESGTYGFQTALSVDSKNRMYMKSYQALFRVDQFTGHVFSIVPSSGTNFSRARNALSFGPGDLLYTHTFSDVGNQLETINPTNAAVTPIGSTGLSNLSALEWDFLFVTPPSVADLSLTKSVDNATPTAGNNVVFTITVTNGGPASATGVVVKDKLPSGFTYVSDDASGAYVSSTGLWTIGTIANAGSASLHITATALAGGNHTNDAEVVDTTTADPDSVPGSGEGDTFASKRSAPASSPALYAVTGAGPQFCGGSPSALYELDPTDAGAAKVADITVGGNAVTHVTGLAFDPTSGQLYGFRNFQGSNCDTSVDDEGTLLAIDKATGVATVVGSNDAAGIQASDMTFAPDGHLFAWSPTDANLYELDTSAGTSTLQGTCSCGNNATGLAADSLGRMYKKDGTALRRINQFTGHAFGSTVFLNSSAHNMLAFGPSDSLYTGFRSYTHNSTTTFTFDLKQVDPETGSTTPRGTNGLWDVSALAWDLGTTSVNIADLSLTKVSDISSPDDWFTPITFTITVTNHSATDAATGVQVYDPVPTGFNYVSDNPSAGLYDSGTGIWNVGTIAASDSETLELVLEIQPSGSYQNTAEVVDSTSYDPDSVPSSVEGDTVASKTITPTPTPGLDAAADVSVSGQATRSSATSKGFTVKITNAGTVNFTVDQSMLDVDVLKNSSPTGEATCKAFSATLKPGRSIRAHCTFNVANAGLTSGDTVEYTATIDVAGDGFTSNDSDSQTQPVS
jgi:uncharacterized repeat protein (TIGR01451 family)